jgi:Uma2 family endonuclease
VGDPRQVSKRGIEGPPKLAVEVLSPTTRNVDRTVKASRVECLRLRDQVYELVVSAEGGETLVHADWPGLSIDLGALLRDT